jgi:mono/diheme cytochrome c family protein
MPAPPHDATGHTWHHPDSALFGITKEGLSPGKYAPRGYQSDMPAFGGVLTDEEIWAVLAYIKSTWPPRELAYQREVDRQSRSRQ